MKFKKEILQNLASEEQLDDYEIIENKISSTGRWSINYTMVFKFEGKFFHTSYSEGATESQDERPYQYANDEIECEEVFPVEKTIIVYEAKK